MPTQTNTNILNVLCPLTECHSFHNFPKLCKVGLKSFHEIRLLKNIAPINSFKFYRICIFIPAYFQNPSLCLCLYTTIAPDLGKYVHEHLYAPYRTKKISEKITKKKMLSSFFYHLMNKPTQFFTTRSYKTEVQQRVG